MEASFPAVRLLNAPSYMKRTIVLLLVTLATPVFAQAPEQIPDPQALYERGETLDAAGRAAQRTAVNHDDRKEAIDLEHRGVIDKQRAIDVDPAVYRHDDELLRRAMRSR